MKINQSLYACRFHPTEGWHELGCDHETWTAAQLTQAMLTVKQGKKMIMGHPDLPDDVKTELLVKSRQKFYDLSYKRDVAEGRLVWEDEEKQDE